MLFYENLEEIIFRRHELFESDELIILSGYIGPKPVERLSKLPFKSTVIYGMYSSESIKNTLHNSLISIHNKNIDVNIFYSNQEIHSKCYVWRKKGNIIHALIGSANFSTNGLTTPYREILAETTFDTFSPLNNYIERILNNSISCIEAGYQAPAVLQESVCLLSLLGRNGEVQNAAGLNWGQNPNNHTTRNDAYIKITTQNIREFPELFPPKQISPIHFDGRGRAHRHNDAIEIIWDDGVIMDGLLFGNQTINGIVYPKQVSSFPHPREMGEYLRHRLNVPLGEPVRRFHLERYGRTDIAVSKLSEGIYKFDFSV